MSGITRDRRRAVVAALAASVLLIAVPALRSQDAPPPAGPERDLVYYYPDTVGRDRAEIVAYMQAYLDAVLAPRVGYPIAVQYFAYLADLETYMAQCLTSGRYPVAGALHAMVALENRERWGMEAAAQLITSQDLPTHTISVATRRGGPVRVIADLAGRTLLAPELWSGDRRRFEQQVLGGRLRLEDLGALNTTESSISAALGLMYGDADAALLSSRVFEVLQERAGGVWRHLHVLHESGPIPVALVVFFPETSERERRIFTEETLRMHEHPLGRRWFDYTRMLRLQAVTWEQLEAQAAGGDGAAK